MLLALLVTAAFAPLLLPKSARACGGCFAPPSAATVVTAHRMAVSISVGQTTLWDQIQYAGDPRDFVWVLPVQGGVAVELADNAFFEALEERSVPILTGTSLNSGGGPCPDCPCCSAAGPGGAPSDTVTVHHSAVIGPYETATIGSDDPNALIAWLDENGYAVPDSTLGLIDHYVDQGMEFAVLRLRPGAGVQQMQPVRVTMPGLVPVFPLRMVGAGVADEVELLLFVIGEGRYAPENYPFTEIDRSALVYDWDAASYNYDEVFDRAVGERAWVTEHAGALLAELPGDDGRVAHARIALPYLTRLRTRLGPQELDQDLILAASSLPDVSRYLDVRRAVGSPPVFSCPPPGSCGPDERSDHGCSATGEDPRSLFPALIVVTWLFVRRR